MTALVRVSEHPEVPQAGPWAQASVPPGEGQRRAGVGHPWAEL